ncbi:MAG: hypothetical protein IJR19_06865 [Lachnospiraceae bacterium]|nr:hypothetical protein [Lachnospiraceae bacterium]
MAKPVTITAQKAVNSNSRKEVILHKKAADENGREKRVRIGVIGFVEEDI